MRFQNEPPALGLVWDRSAMFCFKCTRVGPARGFYSQGLYETKHSGVYRTLNRRPVPGLENQGALRGRARWPWQQSASKAEERRSVKTRAMAKSTSITTTIARVLHPTHLHAEPNTIMAPRSPVRRHATAIARDRHHHHHHHHRSCDRDRDHTRDRSEHCAPKCHCGENISSSPQKTRHFPLSCSHHHYRFETRANLSIFLLLKRSKYANAFG